LGVTQLWQNPQGEWILVGDKHECAAVCKNPMSGAAFAYYSRTRQPINNPAPESVWTDPATQRKYYPYQATIEWDARRPGPGDWGGIGARAKHKQQPVTDDEEVPI
jgi:hypothetical protein